MTPCNRLQNQAIKEINPTAKPSQPAHSNHPSPTQQGHRLLRPPYKRCSLFLSLSPASCLSPSHQVLKRSGIGSKRRYCCSITRRACVSDSPGREGYKETSGEVVVEDVVMFRGNRLHGFSSESPDRPSSSHGSSSYRTNGEGMMRRKMGEKEKAQRKWLVSVSCAQSSNA